MSNSVSIVRVIEDFNNRIGQELKEVEQTVAAMVEDSGASPETYDAPVTVCCCYHIYYSLKHGTQRAIK